MRLRFLPALTALLLCAPSAFAATSRAPAAPAACADFYAHNNHAWIAAHPLSGREDERSVWLELAKTGGAQADALLRAPDPRRGPASKLIADLLAAAGNEAAIESAGIAALRPWLDRIDKLRKPADVTALLSDLHNAGVPLLLDVRARGNGQAAPDLALRANALSLGDPAFYLNSDAELEALRQHQRRSVATWFRSSGVNERKLNAALDAAWVLEVELARATALPRDSAVQPYTGIEANDAFEGMSLGQLLRSQGDARGRLLIDHSAYFRRAAELVQKAPAAQWQSYLRSRLFAELAPFLPRAYRDAHASLFDLTLLGRSSPRSRGEHVQRLLRSDAVAVSDLAYVETYLPSPLQVRANAIAEAVRKAQDEAIERATWLSADGKLSARQRLQGTRFQIALPMAPAGLAGLRGDTGLLPAVLALRQWSRGVEAQTLAVTAPAPQHQPLVLWQANTERVIVTAAALQAPVLSANASAADYGAFGALLAQQLSLGLQQWNGADAMVWSQREAALRTQYGSFLAVGTLKVDGARTLSQNLADLAGLEVAWLALQTSNPDASAKKAFFSAWAGLWASIRRDPAAMTALPAARHAPPRWRVNGPLMNLPAFAQTYSCRGRAAMLRPAAQQVAIWR